MLYFRVSTHVFGLVMKYSSDNDAGSKYDKTTFNIQREVMRTNKARRACAAQSRALGFTLWPCLCLKCTVRIYLPT